MPLYISLGKNVEIDESMFGTITKTTKVYKSDSTVLILQCNNCKSYNLAFSKQF